MDTDAVRDEVLDRVLPGEAERAENQDRFAQIRDFIADEFGKDAALMGSTAKDTFMSGDKDLDIFVFFDTGTPEDDLEEDGIAIGTAVFDEFGGDCDVEFAEHPYTKGEIDGYEVEIVPAYDVDSGRDIRSAVDRTPFHTDWVNDTLSAAEKEEVVLLKAFLRGQDLYGSTLRIEGFSGYLCELLIAAYGSFDDLLAAASREWTHDQVIDPAGHHPDGIPGYLQDRFDEEDLVVIDPVDPERNVAAVLSHENYARFVYAAWRFRQDPDVSFFFPEQEPVDEEDLAARVPGRGDFVQVAFPAPDMLDDILYPQLRRLHRRIIQVLEDDDFRTVHSGFHVGDEEVRFLFELLSGDLPAMRKHRGPQVFHNAEHVANFTDAYDHVWVEDDRLTTIIERDHTTATSRLDALLSGDLQADGVPANLVDHVAQRDITDLTLDGAAWRTFLRDEFNLTVGR